MVSNRGMDTIGSRVRALRKARGLTQTQLAALVGITQGSLSLIEKNLTQVPSGSTLAALCAALRTTPDFIIAGLRDDSGNIQAAIDEHELVHLWRDMPPEARQLLLESAGLRSTPSS